MKQLPSNAEDLAASFNGLAADRKAQILDHIQSLPADRQASAIGQIMTNGGDEARFLNHVLGKSVPVGQDAKQNKKIDPIQTK